MLTLWLYNFLKQKMRNLLIIGLFAACSLSMSAQQAKEDFSRDITLSASNYVAYRVPTQKLTPAPKGYKPFYISHYGRHGSRYLIGTRDYNKPYFTLLKADKQNQLTDKGKDVLRRLALIRNEASKRDGELTQLGAEQHRGIARRMMQNFPQVFSGKAHVDAKSTVVIRCILSMENALQQLVSMNPELVVTHDASYHDMYYMNHDDKHLDSLKMTPEARTAYNNFSKHHENYQYTMQCLFKNSSYWQDSIKALELNDELFHLAGNVQSTELRKQLSLYDIFSKDEIYDDWLRTNAWWYITYGPSPLNGGTQPYSQRYLLKNIITTADSCIQLEHPGATLRYGHDTMVMPLTALLDLDGMGKQISDLEQLDKQNWCDYKIFPMACNIQFIFYRKKGSKDIIFKILRNEKEATLPIHTDMAPYYHWSDFRTYYLNKINAYKD